jgi:hypothetical protein
MEAISARARTSGRDAPCVSFADGARITDLESIGREPSKVAEPSRPSLARRIVYVVLRPPSRRDLHVDRDRIRRSVARRSRAPA